MRTTSRVMNEFDSDEDVIDRLAAQDYVASREIATTVRVAVTLRKPVLLEGPAGVGKTSLALSLAAALDSDLHRLQCYEGIDETKALYEWEYGKQMLYTQLLREGFGDRFSDLSIEEAVSELAGEESAFFSENFLLPRPILRALLSEEQSVLLIDEIDRADDEFEAFLLETLDDYQVTVPEFGTVSATHPPVTFVTSNNTRMLSDALRRRCLYLYIDYPGPERELEIVLAQAPEAGESLSEDIVAFVSDLRSHDLRKTPGVSETVDWAQTLASLGYDAITREAIETTTGALIKHHADHEAVLATYDEWAEEGGHERSHEHDHGNGHNHGGGHDHDGTHGRSHSYGRSQSDSGSGSSSGRGRASHEYGRSHDHGQSHNRDRNP
jgi:MoxR-like ATPase